MNLKILNKISYGMYIISSKKDNRFNGQIANTLFQAASSPVIVGVSISKRNLTHEFIVRNRAFTASILSKETPMHFIGNFGFKSGRDTDKFRDVNHKVSVTGNPVVLENSIGYLEVSLIDGIDAATHTVFMGKVIDAEITKDLEPMTYGYYHEIKRGGTPENAPTYQGSESKKQEKKMQKYVCKVCGYVYDPEKGDPDGGISPDTEFESLPDSWVCPVCGAAKDQFEAA